MENTDTGSMSTEAQDSNSQLQQEVTALISAKDGIDENHAKRLRKQWNLHPTAQQDDTELSKLFAQLHQLVHAQVELREQQCTQLEDNLQQLRRSLEAGNVKSAQQLEQSTIRLLNQIVGLSDVRRQKIITELEEVAPKIRELTGWRKWSTDQARENMVAEVKNLHDSKLSPAKIAQSIQQFRKQWQDWDALDGGLSHKLNKIFYRACKKAYEPCKAYFDQQKQQRQKNTELREKICADLEKSYEQIEWHNPDWKHIQQLVRKHIQKWRSTGHTDYRLQKPLQQRFALLTEKFEERLERERQRNYKMREKLVEQTVQLEAQENITTALAELKQISQQWTPTVTSSQSKENALWKRFSEARTHIYEKRDRARKEFNHSLQQNLAAKQSLCTEIETSCQGNIDNNSLRSRFGQWKSHWEQLGQVPKPSVEKINKRYRDALQHAQKTLADIEVTEKLQLQNLLQKKSQLCARVEEFALSDKIAKSDAKLQKLLENWKSLPALPTELEQTITERYRLATQALDKKGAQQKLRDSLPKNLETLHALLLHLEILAGLDSPAEFAKQRMALQISRLSAAMGKTKMDEDESSEQLIRDILLVGAVDAKQHKAAFKRLNACCKALNGSALLVNKTTKASISL